MELQHPVFHVENSVYINTSLLTMPPEEQSIELLITAFTARRRRVSEGLICRVFGDEKQELFALNDVEFKLAILKLIKKALNLVEVRVGEKMSFLHNRNGEVVTSTFVVERINFEEPVELLLNNNIISNESLTIDVVVDGIRRRTARYTLDKRFLYSERTTVSSYSISSRDRVIVHSILVSGIDLSNLA